MEDGWYSYSKTTYPRDLFAFIKNKEELFSTFLWRESELPVDEATLTLLRSYIDSGTLPPGTHRKLRELDPFWKETPVFLYAPDTVHGHGNPDCLIIACKFHEPECEFEFVRTT